MLKRIIGIALSMVLILNVAGCGITEDDFITAVNKYKIFDDNNAFNMQTVSDFVNEIERLQMECLHEYNKKVPNCITMCWYKEEEEASSNFIDRLKQTEDFVYDKKKYYGFLDISVVIFSSAEIKASYRYTYLFSLDKDGAVVPEAAGFSNSVGSNYKDITTDPASIQLSMQVCLEVTETLKEKYAE